MTAVQWLEDKFQKFLSYYEGNHKAEPYTIQELSNDFEQAKEMEKQQMENVARDWWKEGADYVSDVKREYVSFDKYYKMKFEKGGAK